MNVLLVSPATPDTFWSFKHVMRFISKRAAYPPLGLLTVAGMLPKSWRLKLIDLNVEPLRDEQIRWADYVFLSGMIVHADSAREVIERCHAHEKPVVAGGPLFTTGHEKFPEVDHVVIGEAENLIGELVQDMLAGKVRRFYRAPARPDLSDTPIPRWDLIRGRNYATMPLQFSRGCPFDCEFCDIIVMYGRKPRVKTPEQMIAELDSLIDFGWKGPIFIVDDNFIGHKVKVKTLLRELIAWRKRRRISVSFTTEASLNLVDDSELVDLMVQAGFKRIFIGIETPEEDSLQECAKVQNTRRDLVASVRKLHNSGLEVMAGFILGFDNDKPNIFERQRQFIQEAGVVTAMVGLLTALPETRLFTRLAGEGRILQESTGNNLDGVLNFIPRLDRETLTEGYRNLVKHLYTPQAYYRRIFAFLREYRPRGPRGRVSWSDVQAFVKSLWIMGVCHRGRREYWKFLTKTLLFYRHAFAEAMTLAITGHHFRRVAALL